VALSFVTKNEQRCGRVLISIGCQSQVLLPASDSWGRATYSGIPRRRGDGRRCPCALAAGFGPGAGGVAKSPQVVVPRQLTAGVVLSGKNSDPPGAGTGGEAGSGWVGAGPVEPRQRNTTERLPIHRSDRRDARSDSQQDTGCKYNG
jgi:hypothetical protein